MFDNPNIQSTINQFNGTSIRGLVGFEMYSSPDTVDYYVMNQWDNKTYILDDEWSLISSKSLSYPSNMISINNSLYITGSWNVWKVDQDLIILIEYNPSGDYPCYGVISYNPSNGLIYVAAWNLFEIQVFNLDLTLMRRLTSPYAWSITVSSNQLYVGTSGGIVLVYQNEILINQFSGCNGNSCALNSILFDLNGYMATTCFSQINKLYLFSPEGSFTGKYLTTPDYPRYIGFDSKGRFIIVSENQIIIYN